jgi:hypothetical protein
MFCYALAERMAAIAGGHTSVFRVMDAESRLGKSALGETPFVPVTDDMLSLVTLFISNFPYRTSLDTYYKDRNKFPTNWRNIQHFAAYLAKAFVDPSRDFHGWSVDKLHTDYEAAEEYYGEFTGPAVDPVQNGVITTYGADFPDWPPPSGFTRKIPREITSTSSPGSPGERAMFVYSPNGLPSLDGPFVNHEEEYPAQDPSPVNEKGYSRMFFERSGSGWVLSSDQSSPPDIITLRGVARSGDIFGPWIVNETRDAINMLTRTIDLGDLAHEGKYLDRGSGAGEWDESEAREETASNEFFSAGEGSVNYGASIAQFVSVSQSTPSYTAYPFCARKVNFYVPIEPRDRTDPESFDKQSTDFEIRSEPFVDPFNGGTEERWDMLNFLASSGVSSEMTVVCPKSVGDVETKPKMGPNPGASQPPTLRGWQTPTYEEGHWRSNCWCLIDWDVSGGFKYTSSSSPSEVPDRMPRYQKVDGCLGVTEDAKFRLNGEGEMSYTFTVTDNGYSPTLNQKYTGSGLVQVQNFGTIAGKAYASIHNDGLTRRVTYSAESPHWRQWAISHEGIAEDGSLFRIDAYTNGNAGSNGQPYSASTNTLTATLYVSGKPYPVTLAPTSKIEVSMVDECSSEE